MSNTIRVSDVEAWTQCEMMALRTPPTQPRLAVAAFVGTLAHWMLVPDHDPMPVPAVLSYDAITPDRNHAEIQAKSIARAARERLAADGWTVIAAEEAVSDHRTAGSFDLFCWRSATKERAIIDLKTGQRVGAGAWLQVGGYLELQARGCDFGGVLHSQRCRIDREPRTTLDLRPATLLRHAWRQRRDRITEVIEGAAPLPTPGDHCGRCRVPNCPVNIR